MIGQNHNNQQYTVPGDEFRAVFLDSIALECGTREFSYGHFIVFLPLPLLSQITAAKVLP